jgi:hypothetical protein
MGSIFTLPVHFYKSEWRRDDTLRATGTLSTRFGKRDSADSYYLTTNLSVSSGIAITITANKATRDTRNGLDLLAHPFARRCNRATALGPDASAEAYRVLNEGCNCSVRLTR